MVDSNDGDYIWIALLQSPDRIDPETSKFNSRVWVKLRGQEASRTAHKKRKTAAEAKKQKANDEGDEAAAEDADAEMSDPIDGRDVYININRLYILMGEDPDLKYAQFPQGMAVLLYILGGTDFFDDLDEQTAIFHGMGWEKCVWETWCTHKERFANLIMVFYTGPAGYNQPEICRRPYVDEEAMITFFQQCYATKYGVQVRKLYDTGKMTIAQLQEFTQSFARKCKPKPGEEPTKYQGRLNQALKKAMPPTPVLQRYVRLALLNFSYWLNGYRPNGDEYCNPLEEYEGFPYYGYMVDPDYPGHYKLSPIVSGPKPVPDTVVPHLGLHMRGTGSASSDAVTAQSVLEQAAQADAEAQERAKEELRMERQRKMAAKEKRLAAAQNEDAPKARPVSTKQTQLPLAYKVPAVVAKTATAGAKRKAPEPTPPRTEGFDNSARYRTTTHQDDVIRGRGRLLDQ